MNADERRSWHRAILPLLRHTRGAARGRRVSRHGGTQKQRKNFFGFFLDFVVMTQKATS